MEYSKDFPKCPCGRHADMAIMGEDETVWYCNPCLYGNDNNATIVMNPDRQWDDPIYTYSDAPKITNNVWKVDRSNQ